MQSAEAKDLLIIFLTSLVGGILFSRVSCRRLSDRLTLRKSEARENLEGAEELLTEILDDRAAYSRKESG